MKNPGYKIKMHELDSIGEIRKLEHDGHTRESIHKQMYNLTDGMSTPERRKMMKKLYERGDC